jgi:hypothetical protein
MQKDGSSGQSAGRGCKPVSATTPARSTLLTTRSPEHAEIVREAVTMMLYVSVVEIAELAALPESHVSGHATGPVGAQLLAIIWGTAVGLAATHWFAFRLAGRAFRGDRVTGLDTQVGLAQIGAAMFVAAVSSVPVLFFGDVREQEFTGLAPAVLIGIIGYLIARETGKNRLAAAVYGVTALGLGVLVATVKFALAAH